MVLLSGLQHMKTILKPVRTAQKKVIRAITFSEPNAHFSPLFSDLKILKLGGIYQLYISSLFLNVIMTLLQLILEIF